MKRKSINVGDQVLWRWSFENNPPVVSIVTNIEKTDSPRQKYGDSVKTIAWENKDCGVYDLGNGHWCYGDQIIGKLVLYCL